MLVSPKCHPELAGMGIEYSWGLMKRHFRKINDCLLKNLHSHVQTVMSPTNLTVSNVLKFSRRTRDYCRAYLALATSETINTTDICFELIEKMMKQQKTHRSILDMEMSYLNSFEKSTTTEILSSQQFSEPSGSSNNNNNNNNTKKKRKTKQSTITTVKTNPNKMITVDIVQIV